MPEDLQRLWARVMELYASDNERAYLAASAAFGEALTRSRWMLRMRGRYRMVGV